MNDANKKEKERIYLIFSIICIISLVTFITPAHAAVGDLILDTEILLREPDFHDAKNDTGSTTLLKEGYSLSLDKVWRNETHLGQKIWHFIRCVCLKFSCDEIRPGQEIWVTNYSIFKNGDVVKRISVNEGDYFYYNKTINGREYTIIESKFDTIFLGMSGTDLVKLNPVRQYSDGSVIVEPDFITPSLNPYTNETPPEEWNRTFGSVYSGRYGQSLQQTSDGGYILTGSKYMYTTESRSAFLLKTDTNGNEQWNRTFEDIGLENAYSVQQTLDGGYLLAGFSHLEPGYAWLTKTDKNGSMQWIETFAALKPYCAWSVWQTPDGGYILISRTKLYEGGSTEAWVIKTDVNGKQEWNKTFESDCFDEVYSIEQTLDGIYLLAGSKGSYYKSYNACLVKTDASGIEHWNMTIGPGLIATIYSIRQTLDGGYVLAGKIDTAKDPEFKRQIHYSNDDAWLFKIDADGNLEWSKTFGGLRNDEARVVQQTSDGSYIIAGTTQSYGTDGRDLWLVKVAGMEVDAAQSMARLSDDNFTENLQGGIAAEPDGEAILTDEVPVQTPDLVR